jgi:hypothetical protein
MTQKELIARLMPLIKSGTEEEQGATAEYLGRGILRVLNKNAGAVQAPEEAGKYFLQEFRRLMSKQTEQQFGKIPARGPINVTSMPKLLETVRAYLRGGKETTASKRALEGLTHAMKMSGKITAGGLMSKLEPMLSGWKGMGASIALPILLSYLIGGHYKRKLEEEQHDTEIDQMMNQIGAMRRPVVDPLESGMMDTQLGALQTALLQRTIGKTAVSSEEWI